MSMTRRQIVFAAAATALVPVPLAHAGSSLMCPVFDIGDAPSLPWRSGPHWNQPDSAFTAERLVPETLALLTPKTPVLVRMETLRRANIYTRKFTEAGQPALADGLLAQLQARALSDPSDPLALFDAGYFAEALKHWSARHRPGVDGYAWVRRALAARGDDPEMELGAALIRNENPGRPGSHWTRAAAGSKRNPRLASTIASNFPAR